MKREQIISKQNMHISNYVVIPEIWELFWWLFVRNGAADRLNDVKKL